MTGKPLLDSEIEELRRDYENGLTLKEIGHLFRINPDTVLRHVTPNRKRVMGPDIVKKVLGLRAKGLSGVKIGKKLGIGASTVFRILKRASLAIPLLFLAGSSSPPQPFEHSRGAYENVTDACVGETARLSPPRFAGDIARWCHHRTKHSSRGVTIVSRVDGSQIHDRDRPAAHIFYRKLVRKGVLRPGECVFHEAPSEVHPRECRVLAAKWPFRSPVMTPERREAWIGHHHGYERFSTRGPHDNTAYSYITMANDGFSTCWPIWWLDDPGVAAEVTVRRALQRCAGFRRCTFEMIREAW